MHEDSSGADRKWSRRMGPDYYCQITHLTVDYSQLVCLYTMSVNSKHQYFTCNV